MELIIIAAVSQNNVIGSNGEIPWHSKEDFKHFKNTTFGFPIIMGRKTFESIGKPLPGRLNIVLSRSADTKSNSENLMWFDKFEDIILYCDETKAEKVFIIGGESLYKLALPLASKIILSKMPYNVEGDTYFPLFDDNEWMITDKKDMGDFKIYYYERNKKE